MASDDLFNRRFITFIIRFLVAPIPKSKSARDMQAVKDCLKVAGEGGTICIFPEGNRTYSGQFGHMDESIAKLIKILKLPVVLYNIKGGYGTDPRWGKGIRRGKMESGVVRILDEDEIGRLSNDELYELISRSLKVEEVPTLHHFRNRRKAEHLERTLFVCPSCGSISTLISHQNTIRCTKCNLVAEYQEDLTFKLISGNMIFPTVNDWYQYQIDYLKNYDLSRDANIFEDCDVRLSEIIRCKRKIKIVYGKLSMTNKAIGVNSGKKEAGYYLDDILAMTCVGKHKLNFYIGQKIYQLKGNVKFNALKYMQMHYHIRHVKNGENDDFFGI
jgi:1-acyl-sn-glycerol-3-phosphate acyltransferase